MHQVNKIVHDFMTPAFDGGNFKPCFGGAIGNDYGQREPQPAQAHRQAH